jgi:cell division protein FtsB
MRPYTPRQRHGRFPHCVFEGRTIRLRLPLPRGRRRLARGHARAVRNLSLRRVLAAVVAVVCGWVAYAVYAETAAGHSLDTQLSAAQRANARLQHQIDERRAEIAEAQTRQWLVEEARKLGYVLPGERVFVLTTPGASLPPDGGITLKDLPTFSTAPSPGAPSSTPAPVGGPTPGGTPTPFVFNLSTPGH